MSTRHWIGLPGLTLAVSCLGAPALADVQWSGPGYYIEDFMADLVGGPYSNKDACYAAIDKTVSPDDQDDMECDYEGSGHAGSKWSGPGYYLGAPGLRSIGMVGPYSSEAECQRDLATLSQAARAVGVTCRYLGSDPGNN